MATASANMNESHSMSGGLRGFLRRFFDLFSRILFLKKKKKSVSRSKTRRAGAKQKINVEAALEAVLAWSPERVNVIEKLWGEGCISPSSADFLREKLPLLGLDEKKSALLLGAGLGGLGRAMVDETGVWITGIEADEELASIGKEQTKMAGMQKRAPVSLANLEQAKLKQNSFNAAISLESLYRIENKEQLYTAMYDALRVDGEMLMTDFVLPDGDPPNQDVAIWYEREASKPYLWTAQNIHSCLSSLNMDVRPPEDITAKYRGRIFKGFFGYLSNVTKPELLEISDDLINECEYWARLITALDSGGLKVFQFRAIKLPEKRRQIV